MKKNKEQWIDEIMGSLEGMQPARPADDLLAKIEGRIDETASSVVPMYQWRVAAVAAVAVLLLNVFALQSFSSDTSLLYSSESQLETAAQYPLISDYKIYE